MRISPVLADTGRPQGGGAINLLNAGWTFTSAQPLPDGSYALPGQALAVFVEAPWDQLNKPHRMVVELVDDEGATAQLAGPDGLAQARIEQEIVISPVPSAPNGTPGLVSLLFELPAGVLRVAAPRHRYTWRITVGEAIGEVGFWVNAPVSGPVIGGGPSAIPPLGPIET